MSRVQYEKKCRIIFGKIVCPVFLRKELIENFCPSIYYPVNKTQSEDKVNCSAKTKDKLVGELEALILCIKLFFVVSIASPAVDGSFLFIGSQVDRRSRHMVNFGGDITPIRSYEVRIFTRLSIS